MLQVKATNILVLKKLIQAKGVAVEKQFLSQLSPQAQAAYQFSLVSSWIDTAQEENIMRSGARLLFPDQLHALQELGYALGQKTFSGLYSVFLRIPTLPFFIKRMNFFWRRFFSCGIAEIENSKSSSATLAVREIPELCAYQREVIVGYMRVVLETAGCHNIRITIEDSNPACWKWHISWNNLK